MRRLVGFPQRPPRGGSTQRAQPRGRTLVDIGNPSRRNSMVSLRNVRRSLEQRRERVDEALEDLVCLLYTSDAADEEDSVDLGGCRIIKKKKQKNK